MLSKNHLPEKRLVINQYLSVYLKFFTHVKILYSFNSEFFLLKTTNQLIKID